MLDFLGKLLDTSDFVPRRSCGKWTTALVMLHAWSDVLIWLAYLTIPAVLIYFVRQRRDLPFPAVFWMFGAFILSCGFTHLLDVTAFYWPAYRLMGVVKLLTALASWATVAGLIPLLPKALALRSPAELEREIDSRKQAEQKLSRQAGLLDVTGDSIMVLDMDGNITYWNRGAELRYGLTRAEAIGLNAYTLLKAQFSQPPSEILADLLRDGRWEGQISHTKRGGGRIRVASRWVLQRDERGRPISILKVSNDITARERADAKFRGLLESAPDAMVIVDSTGRIVLVNSETEALFGYTRQELLRLDMEHLFPARFGATDPSHRQGFCAALRERCTVAGDELYGLRKDGSEFPVEIRLSPLETEEGALLITAIRDATDRMKAEAVIRERTAQLEALNKELEAFSYSVSHDLRAPLRAIDGFSRILVEEYSEQLVGDARDYLRLVRRNAQQMGRLVDDLLAHARMGRRPVRKQSLDPMSLVQQCADELVREQTGRRIEVSIGDLKRCEADATLLKQVWTNLLSNAIKYTRGRDVATIEVGCSADNHSAAETTYFVRDNGVGFDMRYADKLFGMFQRLHRAEDYEGTGVGLAIVRRIIHRHGGRVWAEARPEQGATFYFTLRGATADELQRGGDPAR
jgi:PAS domain S-box-containing protein